MHLKADQNLARMKKHTQKCTALGKLYVFCSGYVFFASKHGLIGGGVNWLAVLWGVFDHGQYCLVWATKLLLTAIDLVFPALVLGYKSFNCSMYHVPVPMLIEKFV